MDGGVYINLERRVLWPEHCSHVHHEAGGEGVGGDEDGSD